MSETDTVLLRHGSCGPRGGDVAYVRRFLADFPTLSHTETIRTLAEHLGWTTPSGGVRSGAAARLLEELERAGACSMRQQKFSTAGGTWIASMGTSVLAGWRTWAGVSAGHPRRDANRA